MNVRYGDKQQIAEQKSRKKKELDDEMNQNDLNQEDLIKEQK
jgi:hypothetical protein